MDLDEIPVDQALELGKQIKQKKRAQSKTSKDTKKPIKHTPKTKKPHYIQTSGGRQLTEQEQLQAIDEHINTLTQLPSSSRYAQHRLKVLRKAKELLQAGIQRTDAEEKELERLLASLSL